MNHTPTPAPTHAPPRSDAPQPSEDAASPATADCMYCACMPNVQVRDVPDDVHAELVRRAELAGQSLQQFLAAQLATIAATPTIEDILGRIEERPKGRLSAASAIEAIDDERARR